MNLESLVTLSSENIFFILIALALLQAFAFYSIRKKSFFLVQKVNAAYALIEEYEREMFYVKKKFEKFQKEQGEVNHNNDDELLESLRLSEDALYSQINELKNKITILEKNLTQLSEPKLTQEQREEKIVFLYREDFSLEYIAQELNISHAEVDFVLKLHRLK